jgi:hypothetical protein
VTFPWGTCFFLSSLATHINSAMGMCRNISIPSSADKGENDKAFSASDRKEEDMGSIHAKLLGSAHFKEITTVFVFTFAV